MPLPPTLAADVELLTHAMTERLQCAPGELRTIGVVDMIERFAASVWHKRSQPPTRVSGVFDAAHDWSDAETPVVTPGRRMLP